MTLIYLQPFYICVDEGYSIESNVICHFNGLQALKYALKLSVRVHFFKFIKRKFHGLGLLIAKVNTCPTR